MPHSATSVRTLTRALTIAPGETAEAAMARHDRDETDAVLQHLLGPAWPGARTAPTARTAPSALTARPDDGRP